MQFLYERSGIKQTGRADCLYIFAEAGYGRVSVGFKRYALKSENNLFQSRIAVAEFCVHDMGIDEDQVICRNAEGLCLGLECAGSV